MNFSRQTKFRMSLGMIAANVLVIAGEWILRENGGIDPWYAGWMAGWMISLNAAFVFFVFVLPAARQKRG